MLRTLSVLAAGIAVLGLTGCSSSTTATTSVEWQANGMPKHTSSRRSWYQFVYYPQDRVYYEPHSCTWFWFESDRWNDGPVPPSWSRLNIDAATVVTSSWAHPHENFTTVVNFEQEMVSEPDFEWEPAFEWEPPFEQEMASEPVTSGSVNDDATSRGSSMWGSDSYSGGQRQRTTGSEEAASSSSTQTESSADANPRWYDD